jgi:nickel-dependent lactate racemase
VQEVATLPEVSLPIGRKRISVQLERAGVLDVAPPRRRQVDPLGLAAHAADALPDLSRPCLVVPDRTRPLPLAPLVKAIVAALRPRGYGGHPPLVFASGTHRPMRAEEMDAALGDARDLVRPFAHDCDAGPLVLLDDGATRVHEEVARSSGVIAIGPISFHYLAGFGGGRKLVLPGVADRKTATAIHRAALRDNPPGRAVGAKAGILDDNPMHRAIVARLTRLPPSAGLSVVVENGAVPDAEAGELLAHHATLADRYTSERHLALTGQLAAAMVSCGGHPHDVDLVQAHKSLRAVAPILADGARVVLVAELGGGLGHPRFGDWVSSSSATEQLTQLLSRFSIGQQTAWSLRTLLDRFEVGLISTLDDETTKKLGMTPLTADSAPAFVSGRGVVGVLPRGAQLLYSVTKR